MKNFCDKKCNDCPIGSNHNLKMFLGSIFYEILNGIHEDSQNDFKILLDGILFSNCPILANIYYKKNNINYLKIVK